MMLLGFVRLGVWRNFFRAWDSGFSGNLEGEGFILGGVFVVGSGRQVSPWCPLLCLWVSVSVSARPHIGVSQPSFQKAREHGEGESSFTNLLS